MHSTYSDGDFPPARLARTVAGLGYRAFSLTDHDTVAGLTEASDEADRLGLLFVPGMEATVRFRREFFTGSLHLLIYFTWEMAIGSSLMYDLTDLVESGRGPGLVVERVRAINRIFGPDGSEPLLQKPLEEEEIHGYSSHASRRHFALALSEIHGLGPEEVNAVISNDSPAYVPSGVELEGFSPFLSKHPALPVLAHPAAGSYPGDSHYSEVLPPLETVEALLPEFLEVGVRGLEVEYPGHTEEHKELLRQWAERQDLVVTGGSDCHDADKRPMGGVGLTEEELSPILQQLSATY
ncbi:PHP domain-containing protein [Candidatus Fermentibacteria bacterium]|nr:PHP domain-containing protein [Candidatus Fermentibacteria bacterium]